MSPRASLRVEGSPPSLVWWSLERSSMCRRDRVTAPMTADSAGARCGHGCGGFLVAWASSPRMGHQLSEGRPHGGQDAHRTMGSIAATVRRVQRQRQRQRQCQRQGQGQWQCQRQGQGQWQRRVPTRCRRPDTVHGHGVGDGPRPRPRPRSRTDPFRRTSPPCHPERACESRGPLRAWCGGHWNDRPCVAGIVLRRQ
jgi:hypothetical protein